MARKLIVDVVCDLHDGDQIPGARPVRFGINGHIYEVAACPECAARLAGALHPFIVRARRAGVLPDLLRGSDTLTSRVPAARRTRPSATN